MWSNKNHYFLFKAKGALARRRQESKTLFAFIEKYCRQGIRKSPSEYCPDGSNSSEN